MAFEHLITSGQLLMNPYARMRDPLESRELSFGGVASGDDTSPQEALMSEIVARIHIARELTRDSGYRRTSCPGQDEGGPGREPPP